MLQDFPPCVSFRRRHYERRPITHSLTFLHTPHPLPVSVSSKLGKESGLRPEPGAETLVIQEGGRGGWETLTWMPCSINMMASCSGKCAVSCREGKFQERRKVLEEHHRVVHQKTKVKSMCRISD